jgi:SpoVK/Ycf46/Vps4 family AAA+-type ATPase
MIFVFLACLIHVCVQGEKCTACFVVQKTEGYSGSDIKLVAKEAAMRPVRKIFAALEGHTEGIDAECFYLDVFISQCVCPFYLPINGSLKVFRIPCLSASVVSVDYLRA